MNEYPKMLYRAGWDDLSQNVVVNDAEEEEKARSEGFKNLSDAKDTSKVEDTPKKGRPAKTGVSHVNN